MTTKIATLMCNKFGGIRRINATFSNDFISESDMQNVELFNTGINSGVGIRTAKGHIAICNVIPEDERIINIFESVQKNITYCFVHTENNEVGRFYLYDFISQTVILKKDNLIKTGTSCGLDFAQGWSDLFVFSTGEEMFSIEIGATPEIVDMNNLVDKTLGDNIAQDIQQELCEIDSARLNEIRALSIVLSDRNEIWFLIPTTEPDISTIMIYDYIHREWIKRKCPDVTCFNIINNKLYSGSESGRIYEEYKSDTFDGVFIRSFLKSWC